MCVHMESPPPEPETLRGLDAVDTPPPSDSLRRQKGAHRVHGLDRILSYYILTICLSYDVFIGIIDTPSCTTKNFTARNKRTIGHSFESPQLYGKGKSQRPQGIFSPIACAGSLAHAVLLGRGLLCF